jgi:hypothetical protein
MDSLEETAEWSRTYDVFSISRWYLVHTLAFTYEQVRMLSNEDLFYIADIVRDSLLHSLVNDFDEEVRFITRTVLAEKEQNSGK